MQKTQTIKLSINPVFIKNAKNKSYTGYLQEFPDLTAQGKTKEEVVKNLFVSLNDILEFRRGQDFFINKDVQRETQTINLVEAV